MGTFAPARRERRQARAARVLAWGTSSRRRYSTTCSLNRELPGELSPPAFQVCIDGAGAGNLGKRLFLVARLGDFACALAGPVGVLAFPLAHECLGLAEGVLKRGRLGQRFLEEGAPEVGEVVLVRAAEGSAVLARRRDDQRAAVLQRLDEAAAIAGRHNDDLPADGAILEQCRQHRRAQALELHAVLLKGKLVIA